MNILAQRHRQAGAAHGPTVGDEKQRKCIHQESLPLGSENPEPHGAVETNKSLVSFIGVAMPSAWELGISFRPEALYVPGLPEMAHI